MFQLKIKTTNLKLVHCKFLAVQGSIQLGGGLGHSLAPVLFILYYVQRRTLFFTV